MLTLADFMAANVTCTKATMHNNLGGADIDGFTRIGSYEIPRQSLITLGWRHDILNPYSGAIFHAEFHDNATATDLEGEVRIIFESPQKDRKVKMIDRQTNTMYKTAPTDRTKQQLVYLGSDCPLIWAKARSFIWLLFKPSTDGKTIAYNNTNNLLFLGITQRVLE